MKANHFIFTAVALILVGTTYAQGLMHLETCFTNDSWNNRYATYAPDGKSIVYAQSMKGSRPELFIQSIQSGEFQRLTKNEDGETLPAWSPDGNHIIYTAYRGSSFQICKMDISILDK